MFKNVLYKCAFSITLTSDDLENNFANTLRYIIKYRSWLDHFPYNENYIYLLIP